MNIKLMKSPKIGNSLLVVFTFSDKIKFEDAPFGNQFEIKGSKEFLKELKDAGELSGKKGEMALLHSFMIEDFTFNSEHLDEKLHPKRILFVGLGDSKKADNETLRNSAAQIVKKVESLSLSDFSLIIESFSTENVNDSINSISEGLMLGNYSFDEFKTDKEKTISINTEILLREIDEGHKKALEKALITSTASIKARNLVNRPPNIVNPEYLKDFSVDLANQNEKLEIEIFDKNKITELGMRAYLGVAQGSTADPYGIKLTHLGDPENKENNIWLIGKGITFDSGGLSLKPSFGMIEMKSDMSGGAAVITAMEAISKLNPKINVVGLCLATENMPDGGAQRVGDIVKSMSGKTIEIENTDAEGRLTLADAVEYAKQNGAKQIIDVATLTGAMVTALGHGLIGAFGNDNNLLDALKASGEVTGEKIWFMPLDETSKKQNRSKVADIKNTGGRPAGSVTAAHFIGEFVGDTPWVHLDIAGTAMSSSSKGWIPQGATGFPCRTLIETVLRLQN